MKGDATRRDATRGELKRALLSGWVSGRDVGVCYRPSMAVLSSASASASASARAGVAEGVQEGEA